MCISNAPKKEEKKKNNPGEVGVAGLWVVLGRARGCYYREYRGFVSGDSCSPAGSFNGRHRVRVT